MKKTILISFVSLVAGIVLVLVGYFVYSVIKTQNQVARNTVAIDQIVSFLQKATTPATTTK